MHRPSQLVVVVAAAVASAQNTTMTTTLSLTDSTPTLTLSTSVPSPTAPLNSTLPSQAAVPPVQAWCPSEIFCAGSLLQTLNIAMPYVDSKTIVDKPTAGTANKTLADFNAIAAQGLQNITEGQIVQFLEQDFSGEGLELQAATIPDFNENPAILDNVPDPTLKAFTKAVHGFWQDLARDTNTSVLCTAGKCESTLIPLNHTFVVPGGRFREQYYWDSYWIVQGLIKSELFSLANGTLQNFMDEIENFGFIPNGGRIYYLDRSQPPMFVRILADYVHASNDTSILERALPLAETELKWWADNRSFNVTSPFTNITHTVARYDVNNTAPRPESYLEDYQTVHGAGGTDPDPGFTMQQANDIYAELASGAETGWDYSTRWVKDPLAGNDTFNLPQLRTLNIRALAPVCLNSLLYNAHVQLAELYDLCDKKSNSTISARWGDKPSSPAAEHRATASRFRSAILDLMWDKKKLAFYDFNSTASARSSIWSAATFYPLWNGIVPDEILHSKENAFGFFSAVNLVMNMYNGTIPVTFLNSGLQWDWPNAWPPHQFIAIEALRALPANISASPLPPSTNGSFSLIPSGQLGIAESALPPQTIEGSNATLVGDANARNGTVVNGGNATAGEGWRDTLVREMANRYVTGALCSWHATGGELPGLLTRLPDPILNVTGSVNNTGNMFEKFSVVDVDSAGQGGEYTVQAGFGWTNGVLLWVAGEFGQMLVNPDCPTIVVPSA